MTKKKQANREVYARLCWNDNGWRQPAGVSAEAETKKDTFPRKYRFGMEEWLFDFTRLVNGWKYGFLQAALKGFDKWGGATVDVHLYTITPSRERVHVGIIRDLEILTSKEAKAVRKTFRAKGWLREMKAEGKAVGADMSVMPGQHPAEVVNVKFKPSSLETFAAGLTVPKSHPLAARGRYQFESVGTVNATTTSSKGHAPASPQTSWVERGDYERDMPEARLHHHLVKLLRKKHGKAAVQTELGGIDLLLTVPERTVIVELKSDVDARLAVRRALGQLLEYQRFRPRPELAKADLVVVSPGLATPELDAYLKALRTDTGLSVKHVRLTLDDKSIEL